MYSGANVPGRLLITHPAIREGDSLLDACTAACLAIRLWNLLFCLAPLTCGLEGLEGMGGDGIPSDGILPLRSTVYNCC